MNQVANTVILPVEEYEALRAQVAALTQERDEWKDAAVNGGNAGYLRERLAASQAREAKLRLAAEAFSRARKHAQDYGHLAEAYYHADNMNDEALAIPTDTTALDERLAQERERCAESIEFFGAAMNNNYGRECADAIRSLK